MSFVAQAAGVVGTFMQYRQQAAQSKLNARIATRNAAAIRLARLRELDAGQVEQREHGLAAQHLLADQLAVQSTSGFDVNSPSSVVLRQAQHAIIQREAGNIRHQSIIRAYNLAREAIGQDVAAQTHRANARTARFGATLSLISGIGQLAGTAYSGGFAGPSNFNLFGKAK